MKRENVKQIKDQNGASAVEFALILPLLILILFGTIELGLYLFNKNVITNASREGARAGIVGRTPRLTNNDIDTVVKNYCASHLITFGSAAGPVVSIKPINNDSGTFNKLTERCTVYELNGFKCELEVTVDYVYDFLVLSNIGFGSTTITAVSVMKME
jgi:Flp pilus assembly protein TadG